MRTSAKIVFLLCLPCVAPAQFQHNQLDSMYHVVQYAANDTVRMDAYSKLCIYYDDVNLDSSVYYGEKGIAIARNLHLKLNEADMLMNMCFPLAKMGNYLRAHNVLTQALEIAENPSNKNKTWHLSKGQTPQTYPISLLGYIHMGFDQLYWYAGDYEKQMVSAHVAKKLAEVSGDSLLLALVYGDIGDAYFKLNKPDSALYWERKSLEYFATLPFGDRKYEGTIYSSIGNIYQQVGNIGPAKENFERAIQTCRLQNNLGRTGEACLQMALLYQSLKRPDSGLIYAKEALASFNLVGKEKLKAIAYRIISDSYNDQKKTDSSFVYLRLATLLKDSVDKSEKQKLQEFQVAGFNQQLQLQELEKEKIETQSKTRTYVMLSAIAVFMVIAFLLYRNNRNRKKANVLLQKQKAEVQSTLSELKSTQAQLIQSEKMASLGEMTAGIAHEIQNPLNFVNNFSDLNKELALELKQELGTGNIEEANFIADDIITNNEKISHHGKRAESIVTGMLQHTRTASGVKELTDINKLADEYLRLAYNSVIAKDNRFHVEIKTDLDESVGKANIIPQDIGRVLLNLYNNAFYAVTEKKKKLGEGYTPTLSVSTKKIKDKVEIKIADNGNGIPQKIIDKIFNPFFTTKPTGQGTGLGLSLSYDIVKAHGGEIKVETKEGEGTEFTIQLPLS